MTEPLHNVLFPVHRFGAQHHGGIGAAAPRAGRFRAFSAEATPTGSVHPLAVEALSRMKLATTGYRSKSWDEFAVPGASPLHFVFTVCDKAAGEV